MRGHGGLQTGSEGGGGVGFLWQDSLCDSEGRRARTPLLTTPSPFSVCVALGRTTGGFGEVQLQPFWGERRDTCVERESSTKCQVRNLRSAVGLGRTWET